MVLRAVSPLMREDLGLKLTTYGENRLLLRPSEARGRRVAHNNLIC